MSKQDKLYADLTELVTQAIKDDVLPQHIIGSLECLKMSVAQALTESSQELVWQRMEMMKKLAEEKVEDKS